MGSRAYHVPPGLPSCTACGGPLAVLTFEGKSAVAKQQVLLCVVCKRETVEISPELPAAAIGQLHLF